MPEEPLEPLSEEERKHEKAAVISTVKPTSSDPPGPSSTTFPWWLVDVGSQLLPRSVPGWLVDWTATRNPSRLGIWEEGISRQSTRVRAFPVRLACYVSKIIWL